MIHRYCDSEGSVLQVHLGQEVAWSQQVSDRMKPLHLEAGVLQMPDQVVQVNHRPLFAIRLRNDEQWADKLVGVIPDSCDTLVQGLVALARQAATSLGRQ